MPVPTAGASGRLPRFSSTCLVCGVGGTGSQGSGPGPAGPGAGLKDHLHSPCPTSYFLVDFPRGWSPRPVAEGATGRGLPGLPPSRPPSPCREPVWHRVHCALVSESAQCFVFNSVLVVVFTEPGEQSQFLHAGSSGTEAGGPGPPVGNIPAPLTAVPSPTMSRCDPACSVNSRWDKPKVQAHRRGGVGRGPAPGGLVESVTENQARPVTRLLRTPEASLRRTRHP